MGKTMSHLSNEDIYILEKCTNFKKYEIQHRYEVFMRDYPDGQLRKESFQEIFAHCGRHTHVFTDHVFRAIDRDNSGTINFKEFLLAVAIISNNVNPEHKLKWMFSLYDIDGNGTIDTAEMENIIQAIYNVKGLAIQATETPRERTKNIFGCIDINHDGALSMDEFVRGCIQDKNIYLMLSPDGNS